MLIQNAKTIVCPSYRTPVWSAQTAHFLVLRKCGWQEDRPSSGPCKLTGLFFKGFLLWHTFSKCYACVSVPLLPQADQSLNWFFLLFLTYVLELELPSVITAYLSGLQALISVGPCGLSTLMSQVPQTHHGHLAPLLSPSHLCTLYLNDFYLSSRLHLYLFNRDWLNA